MWAEHTWIAVCIFNIYNMEPQNIRANFNSGITKIVYIFANNFFVKDVFYPLEIDRNFLIDIIYPLSANPTKGSNILKQLLECVDHFMGLVLKTVVV